MQALARIGEWAPLAARAPALANALGALGRPLAGFAAGRRLPQFAPRTFRAGFRPQGAGERVILFDDTFNNHFRPATAVAAAKVLEASGCRVELPREHLCCGRPYYDAGMLDRAKAALERILEVVEPGVPLVILEPACLSVFRDELKQLLPGDARAAELSQQATSLGAFLQRRGWTPPRREGQALLHGHCHQKALGGNAADIGLLRAAGLEVQSPDTGCCGMAGSFGLKREFDAASRRIADLVLLPKLRGTAPQSLVVADGFSCREQIEGLGGRRTLHLAEVLARA
jgi:Fe-S oxidoreductase